MVIGLFLGMGVKAFADPSGSGVSSLQSTAGTYYLTGDVTISSSWTPVNGITLDLNGKTITMNESGNAITVSNGVTLTIKDLILRSLKNVDNPYYSHLAGVKLIFPSLSNLKAASPNIR
jgi:hypothetical protein